MATDMEGKSATELLGLGSKAYWTRKYTEAAAYLSLSSEMLVEEHKDDKHNSLGNVYLYYGKALLELAREDGDPLGDAVPKEVGVEDDGSDESGDSDGEAEGGEGEADVEVKEGEEKKVDKEDEEKKEGEEKDKEKKSEEKKDNKTDDDKAADISINGEAATSSGENNEEEGDEEEAEGEDEEAIDDGGEGSSGGKNEEEEPTDLQLAWEVLELAKVIFERRAESGREDFADCLVTLGEVSLESENFDSAIADISSGLAIQKELYTESKDMRKLAETYYKLGMALSAHNKIDEGIENYQTTMEILKERLKVLEAKENPGHSDKNEIKDIKNLIPDLEDKIGDLKTYKEECNNKPEEEPPMVSSPEKKANNISHLVKRKRKLEEVAEDAAASAAKKVAP